MWGQQLQFRFRNLHITPRTHSTRICLRPILHACTGTTNLLPACPPVSLHRSNNHYRYWNICQLSISYAPCLGLGPDLPWDDDRCSGILMLSVERILTFLFATHTNILTSHKSTEPSSSTSTLWERSPTPYTLRIQPQLRFRTLAPGIFGAGSLDQ